MKTFFALFATCFCACAQLPPLDSPPGNYGWEDTFAVNYSYRIADGAPELVTNGGFDSTVLSWTTSGCVITNVTGGQLGNCCEMTKVSGIYQQISQIINTTSGEHYRISMWFKAGSSGNESVVLQARNGSDTLIVFATSVTSASWENIVLDFVATSATSYVNIRKNTATDGTMLFDSVSCKLLTGVNGTLSTGRGKAVPRTWLDTVGKAKTEGGKAYLTGTGVAYDQARIAYPSMTRTPGIVSIVNITDRASSVGPLFGFSGSFESTIFSGATMSIKPGATLYAAYSTITPGTFTGANITRAEGAWALAKLSEWTLIYPYYGSNTPAILSVQNYSADTNTVNSVKITRSTLQLSPLISDNFTDTDGPVAGRISNGLGHPEQNGGAGIVWQAAAGWTIESNHLTNNPASTNMADLICVAQSPVADIITEGKFTASTLDSGYILNLDSFANPQNFVLVYMSGVKIMIVRVVAGTPTTVYNASTSFTYSASAKLMVVHDRVANEYRVFYNNVLITAVTLDANYNTIKNNTLFGFYGSGGQQYDDPVVWDRGSTSNAYSALDTIK